MSFEHPIDQPSQELQKGIEKIERLPCAIILRIQMILVLLGLKPAMAYTLTTQDGDPEHVAEVLRETGLFVELEKKGPGCGILIAQKSEYIQELASLREESKQKHYSESYYERYGQLMGYPQTAIDAFIGRIPALTEQESFQIDPTLLFSITFSKDHWKEEAAVMREWTERIKEQAPELYEEAQQKISGKSKKLHRLAAVQFTILLR